MLLLTVLDIVHIILNAVWWLIIVQAVLSWLVAFNVISFRNETFRSIWAALERITDPLYRPIRKILPDFGALDLSPMVVLVLIVILDGPVLNYFRVLALQTM